MSRVDIRAPGRLHFGLLGWGPEAPRQFGGVGLMIDAPGVSLSADPAARWGASGPLAARSLAVAGRVSGHYARQAITIAPLHISIHEAPPEHVGLGTGTQLSLSVARAVARANGLPDPSPDELAAMTGRGLRSGVGLHGHGLGGLVVDGGRRGDAGIPPLLARLEFPADWSILVVVPGGPPGLHGPVERSAFDRLPPVPDALTDRLCRLVLLGLLPAVAERDLASFGAALTELQEHVGRRFAPAQGGIYARPEADAVVRLLRAEGLHGVGQSSWGPALYAFTDAPAGRLDDVIGTLRRSSPEGLDARWTKASAAGADLAVTPGHGRSTLDTPRTL